MRPEHPFPAQRDRGEQEHQDERRNLGHDEREAGGRERMRGRIFAELGREEHRVGTGSGRDPVHGERQRPGAEEAADDPHPERERGHGVSITRTLSRAPSILALSGGARACYAQRMKIAILGRGGIGSTFAFQLARAGHDVTVIARGARLAYLERE
ncbi:hypothetical protein OV079_24005 [Nannocystis pusilla]|uniref:Ketopantoate reductase N-terminal domain-containing protein n=1 Tax=Nannocystis pusilla TaxID=889268 RepID=A0A9X3EZK3_9BACT|nr:2-dehydropantoate 2-reductase N-terminal domain-containing protein [Nannocystis pusilla]MCY1008568.1 hypothetical protein [Nannocystis pusilla]